MRRASELAHYWTDSFCPSTNDRPTKGKTASTFSAYLRPSSVTVCVYTLSVVSGEAWPILSCACFTGAARASSGTGQCANDVGEHRTPYAEFSSLTTTTTCSLDSFYRLLSLTMFQIEPPRRVQSLLTAALQSMLSGGPNGKPLHFLMCATSLWYLRPIATRESMSHHLSSEVTLGRDSG
jgi:hypothetical protein